MPKRKKYAEEDLVQDLEKRVKALEGQVAYLQHVHMQETEAKEKEHMPNEERHAKRRKIKKNSVVRNKNRAGQERKPRHQIEVVKDVIRAWRNDIYNCGAAGGQNFMIRATKPMSEDKELRDMLENESPWLAASEGKSDESAHWILKLFCKGNHHKPEDQWESPFEEMFAENKEKEE